METLGRRQVAFHSITEHIDTRSSGRRLVFHMMAALAEFERTLISERIKAGIAAARISGRQIGRQPLLSIVQLRDVRQRIDQRKREREGNFSRIRRSRADSSSRAGSPVLLGHVIPPSHTQLDSERFSSKRPKQDVTQRPRGDSVLQSRSLR